MHDDDAGSGLRNHACHIRISTQAGDVIDNIRARIHRSLSDGGLVGINRNQGLRLAAELLDDGDHALNFLFEWDAVGAGAGGFAADIEDVRPFLNKLQSLFASG